MLTDRLRNLPLKAQLLHCLRLHGILPQRINALGGWCTDSVRLKLSKESAQLYSLKNSITLSVNWTEDPTLDPFIEIFTDGRFMRASLPCVLIGGKPNNVTSGNTWHRVMRIIFYLKEKQSC